MPRQVTRVKAEKQSQFKKVLDQFLYNVEEGDYRGIFLVNYSGWLILAKLRELLVTKRE